ncbi:6689_t:CDS:2 [Ambispora gerdemannii]|uniref:6689_t:CDS:1 n=1 Tax=Ambispora gerdemannii TaxID=144530 RepID=A0A9N9GJC0_9GLOM|nr:6689_t:CDS:2 [Ambispora gerdemannii]
MDTSSQYYPTDHNNTENNNQTTNPLIKHHNPLLEGQQLSQYLRHSMEPSNPTTIASNDDQQQFDFVMSAGHVKLMSEPPPYDQFNIEWPNVSIPITGDPPEFTLESGQQQLFEPEEQNLLLDKFIHQYLDVNPGNNSDFMLTPEIQFYSSQSPSKDTTSNHQIIDDSSVVDGSSSLASTYIYGENGITNLDGVNSSSQHRQQMNEAFLGSNSARLSPKSTSSHNSSTNTSNNSDSSSRKHKQTEDDNPRSAKRFSSQVISITTSPLQNGQSSQNSPLQLSFSVNKAESLSSSSTSSSPTSSNRTHENGIASSSSPTTPTIDDVDAGSETRDEFSSSSSGSKSSRKPYKELLTEEEKRANHIASEQKRRNTIRAGFKELTDIIPTLKSVNNSKSTILFKAVDYIRYLERRNRNLKERANLLEMRVEMEMRSGRRIHHPAYGFGYQRMPSIPMGHVNPTYGIMSIAGHPAQHMMGGTTSPHH